MIDPTSNPHFNEELGQEIIDEWLLLAVAGKPPTPTAFELFVMLGNKAWDLSTVPNA